jgi:putative transposase
MVTATVVKRGDDAKGSVALPRRWVVERALGWLTRNRGLARDYERLPTTHVTMATIAMTIPRPRRLARPTPTAELR